MGVDFIKTDDIARPVNRGEIAVLQRAIRNTGRTIVLSLSPTVRKCAMRIPSLGGISQLFRSICTLLI